MKSDERARNGANAKDEEAVERFKSNTTRRVIQMKFFKSVRSWGVLGLLLALVLAAGYGQVPQPVPPAMQQLHRQFMQQVSQLIVSAAKELGVTLPSGMPIPELLYAARSYDHGPILVGAPVSNLERVTLKDLDRGAILGVVYLQFPPPKPGLAPVMPAGFYKLRVFMIPPPIKAGAPNAKAQFIDKDEKVITERPATVGTSESETLMKVTGRVDPSGACVDFHWGRIEVEFCFSW